MRVLTFSFLLLVGLLSFMSTSHAQSKDTSAAQKNERAVKKEGKLDFLLGSEFIEKQLTQTSRLNALLPHHQRIESLNMHLRLEGKTAEDLDLQWRLLSSDRQELYSSGKKLRLKTESPDTSFSVALESADNLPAGRYLGEAYLYDQAGNRLATRSIMVYVRHSIFWVVLAIILGGGLGFLRRFVMRRSERMGLIEEVERLRYQLRELDKCPEKVEIEKELNLLYRELLIVKTLTPEGKTKYLNQLQELEGRLISCVEKEQKLARVETFTPRGGEVLPPSPGKTGEKPRRKSLASRLNDLHNWIRATLSQPIVYHLANYTLALVLFLLFVLFGIDYLYLQAEQSTFGDDGVYDYLPIFLWAMGSNFLSAEFSKQLLGRYPPSEKKGGQADEEEEPDPEKPDDQKPNP